MSLVLFHLSDKKAANLLGSQGYSLFKLLFIEKGEGFYQINHRTISVVAGDLFLIAPKETYDLSGLRSTETWVVAFDRGTLVLANTDAKTFLMLYNEVPLLLFMTSKVSEIQHFQLAPEARFKWLIRLQQLEHELGNQPLGFAEVAESLLIVLIFEFARLAQPQLKKYSLQFSPLLIEVFRFIEVNYHNPISLCDVAKAVARSPAYLTDLVRRETGKTVLNWIVECRMANARCLLRSTDHSVDQIAESVGYLDRRHFSRQFLRLHKATPQAWRHAHHN